MIVSVQINHCILVATRTASGKGKPENMTASPAATPSAESSAKRRYARFLLLVAGLGGLLYGIDVGIIGGALPYLEATSQLTPATAWGPSWPRFS
jgi:hypothetical protein